MAASHDTSENIEEMGMDEVLALVKIARQNNHLQTLVDCYSRVVQLKVEEFDEHHVEVAPWYLKYAEALLDQNKTDIFDETAKRKIKERAEKIKEQEEKELTKKEGKAEEDDEENARDEEKSSGKTEKEELEEGQQEQKEEENVSNLQIAWEVLELARMIYQGQKQPDNRKLADVHLVLGNVALWDEAMPTAQQEFHKALEYLNATKDENIRREKAEVYFQLGLLYSFAPKSAQVAKENYEKAKGLLEQHAKVTPEDAKALAGVIADLELRIMEVSVAPEDATASFAMPTTFGTASGFAKQTLPAGPVNDMGTRTGIKRKASTGDVPEPKRVLEPKE